MNHNGKSRDELTREANQVRTKLIRTVEQLDKRRHEAVDLGRQLKHHLRQLVLGGAVLLLATAGAVVLAVQRITSAAERRGRGRWIAARDAWRHPERIRGERRSFFRDLARSVVLSLASSFVSVPARRALRALLAPEKPSKPR